MWQTLPPLLLQLVFWGPEQFVYSVIGKKYILEFVYMYINIKVLSLNFFCKIKCHVT